MEVAVRMEALEAKVDNLVTECLKIREENVNLKELVENVHRSTTVQRENKEKSDMKIKELKEEKSQDAAIIRKGKETPFKSNIHE